MNMEYVYFILQGIDKLMANQQLLDSISRKHNQLIRLHPDQAENLMNLKLLRQREKAITIERDHRKTTFHIHDVNFANIDDWDVLKQNLSADDAHGSSMSD